MAGIALIVKWQPMTGGRVLVYVKVWPRIGHKSAKFLKSRQVFVSIELFRSILVFGIVVMNIF